MKKIFAIIVVVCFAWFSVNAQSDTSFKLIRIVKGDISAFSVDNLDNIYILDNRNQLKKYNSNGDSVAVFNDVKKYGQVTYMDVSNPLKVLLYYQNFSTVVMLDRVLNIRNIVDLRKQNIFRAKAIGQSYDNKIWVYDELEYKLKKLDEDGKLLQETPDFRLLLGQALTPQKIFDENKYVYLYDSTYGVYVFDYYGALKNNIMIQRWNNFKVAGKFIFGSKSDTLFRYEISAFQYDDWKMPEQIYRSRSFDFSASRLYALKKDGIEIYSIR
jgi:hypothetical protein